MSKQEEEKEILQQLDEWDQTLKRQPHRRGSIEGHKALLHAQLADLRQGMGVENEFREVRERQRPRRASLEPVTGSIAASAVMESAFEDEEDEESDEQEPKGASNSDDGSEPVSSRGQKHIAQMCEELEKEYAQYDELKKQQPHRRMSIENKQARISKRLEELRQGMGVDSELRKVIGGGRRRRASLEPRVSGIPEGVMEGIEEGAGGGDGDTGIRGVRAIEAEINEELERYEKGQEETHHTHVVPESLHGTPEALHQGYGEEGEMEKVIGGGRRRRASIEPTEAQILESFQENEGEDDEDSDASDDAVSDLPNGNSSVASDSSSSRPTRGARKVHEIEQELLNELERHDRMLIEQPHRRLSIEKHKAELHARLEALRQGQGEADEMDKVIGGGRRRRASLEPGDARIPQPILESNSKESEEQSDEERVRKPSYAKTGKSRLQLKRQMHVGD